MIRMLDSLRRGVVIVTVALLALAGTVAVSAPAAAAPATAAPASVPLEAVTEQLPELSFDDPTIDWADILVDGDDVERDAEGKPYNVFGGFGSVSCNNTSNLLLDYKEENPDAYWRIMELLFDPVEGAGLAHIKVELGSDTNTSSGAEPATKRSADEPANVLRGAGFHFIADALTINPDIAVEALRWGEPSWTGTDIDLRYSWYKETIDAAFDTYGIEFDYLSPSQNEVHGNYIGSELAWTVEFAKRLEADALAADARYDYGAIKIVALDSYRNGETVAGAILNSPEALEYVDTIGIHYTIGGGPNLTRLNKEYGMEVLYSEGVAPMIDPEYRLAAQPELGGIGGTVGAVDIADRFINAYRWEGSIANPAHMTSFLFQPAVSALYEGSQYSPKHLIRASDPWSGYYEGGVGIVLVRHFTQFIDHGWEYIEGASYGDGNFADGGTAVESSTRTYLTLRTPEGADDTDLTQVHANNTAKTRYFEVKVRDLDLDADQPLSLWQTTGPEGGAIDENYFQNIGYVTPVRTDADDGGEYRVYRVAVEPYSILTLSTMPNGLNGATGEYRSGEFASAADDTVLELPYTDDFEYDEYPATDLNGQELSYVERRGGSPRYTADQNGAFEVVETTDAAHGNVLEQRIHADNRGYTWNVWGNGSQNNASTAPPATVLGDHTWTNYTAQIDFKLDTNVRDTSLENFAGLGVRQVVIGGTDLAAYSARVYQDGRWELRRFDTPVASGSVFLFDSASWHRLAVEARENVIVVTLDGERLASYADTTGSPVMGGRIALVSGYYSTQWDDLEITPIDGFSWHAEKLDDASERISYEGASFRQVGFVHFNRTNHVLPSGARFSLDFTGSGVNLFGASGAATLAVSVDGGDAATVTTTATGDRRTSHWIRGLDESVPHTLDVQVTSGTFTLDGIDLLTGGDAGTVDPAEKPVAVSEPVERLATLAGDAAELPSTVRATSAAGGTIDAEVDWLVPSGAYATPYALVKIDGTFVANPGLAVSAYVEVVPRGARYFIDANSTASAVGSRAVAYPAVVGLLASEGADPLLNDAGDAAYTAERGWGYVGTPSAKAPLNQPVYDKMRETGWYAPTSTGQLVYRFTLPAGEYTVTSGHTEWWNPGSNRTRSMTMNASWIEDGAAVTEQVGTLAFPNGSIGRTGTVSGTFTLSSTTEVAYTVANAGGTEAPVISWLGVHEVGEATDRTALEGLLAEAASKTPSDYAPERWSAFREVAIAAKAVADDPGATQAELDDAAASLRAALDALELDIAVTVGTRCVARKVVVTAQVKNQESVPVDLVLDSSYGSRSFEDIASGSTAPTAFSTRLADVPAGSVSVAATATIDGRHVTVVRDVAYEARSCG